MTGWELRRYLAREVHGRELGRRPARRRFRHPDAPPRDSKYLCWIRALPCAVCGRSGNVEAAHTGAHALAQKSSDYSTIPLCVLHHRSGNEALDKIGRERFERRFHIRIAALTARLNLIWRKSWNPN